MLLWWRVRNSFWIGGLHISGSSLHKNLTCVDTLGMNEVLCQSLFALNIAGIGTHTLEAARKIYQIVTKQENHASDQPSNSATLWLRIKGLTLSFTANCRLYLQWVFCNWWQQLWWMTCPKRYHWSFFARWCSALHLSFCATKRINGSNYETILHQNVVHSSREQFISFFAYQL